MGFFNPGIAKGVYRISIWKYYVKNQCGIFSPHETLCYNDMPLAILDTCTSTLNTVRCLIVFRGAISCINLNYVTRKGAPSNQPLCSKMLDHLTEAA